MIAVLTGMEAANASHYDGATSLAEAVTVAIAQGRSKRRKVILSPNVHPHYRAVTRTYHQGTATRFVGDKSGRASLEDLVDMLDDNTAMLVVQYPNFFGQIEDFADATISANDCFRPVSRLWDRITRPEQILRSLPQAMRVLTDPAECGPVTLCLPQDVQAEAYDYPMAFFRPRTWLPRRPPPDTDQLAAAASVLARAKAPLIIAGGGVHYGLAAGVLADFAERHGVPVAETQAGKGALPWDHALAAGALGVTGAASANALAAEADVVLAVGTRLTDFTTASRSLFANPETVLVQLNVAPFDAAKHAALPLVADAALGLAALSQAMSGYRAPAAWCEKAARLSAEWNAVVARATAPSNAELPSDAQVLGAVNRNAAPDGIVVCAAGGLPGELHKLWRVRRPGTYHVEYGYSCMGYEIAGGLGVKLAAPDRGSQRDCYRKLDFGVLDSLRCCCDDLPVDQLGVWQVALGVRPRQIFIDSH